MPLLLPRRILLQSRKEFFPKVTGATNPSGLPFPLPIRTSAGFFVIGLSKKYVPKPDPDVAYNVSQQYGQLQSDFRHPFRLQRFYPKEPNASSLPRPALPFILPFCCLLNLVFFGCNISYPVKLYFYSFCLRVCHLFRCLGGHHRDLPAVGCPLQLQTKEPNPSFHRFHRGSNPNLYANQRPL